MLLFSLDSNLRTINREYIRNLANSYKSVRKLLILHETILLKYPVLEIQDTLDIACPKTKVTLLPNSTERN